MNKNKLPGYPAVWGGCDSEYMDGPKYRYTLWRIFEQSRIEESFHQKTLPIVNFCLLNPSTADMDELDPTLRRCRNYTKRWGYAGMVVTNIFAVRATDPDNMREADNPIGPENNKWIKKCADFSEKFVAGWGVNGDYKNRERDVIDLVGLDETYCLETTKNGHPNHPLFEEKTLRPKPLTDMARKTKFVDRGEQKTLA